MTTEPTMLNDETRIDGYLRRQLHRLAMELHYNIRHPKPTTDTPLEGPLFSDQILSELAAFVHAFPQKDRPSIEASWGLIDGVQYVGTAGPWNRFTKARIEVARADGGYAFDTRARKNRTF